jgi:Na+/proline symporter
MISPGIILLFIVFYFSLLMFISRSTSGNSGDSTYFDGNRESPWFLVAFGMIGSGISAVSLVSIPGNVGNDNLYYFQFILGTILGYLFIAFVLIPVFHRLKLVSVYGYLDLRFGKMAYRTGSLFFLVSQSFGAAFRLLLSVKILQSAFFGQLGIPHQVTVLFVLVLIWLYTGKSGIKTIVWTDALQSLFLITVIIVSILTVRESLGLSFTSMLKGITTHPYAKAFNWDPSAGSNFFKQFISGLLITVALVGLDQSMIQKSLTIGNVRDARKNVLAFSIFIALAQTLFLGLGIMLYLFVGQKGILLPRAADGTFLRTDALYPELTLHHFGPVGAIAFFIGVVASTFATIDSCITALTTSFCYDFLGYEKRPHAERVRLKKFVLTGVNAVIFCIVMLFWNSEGAIIHTIFKIAGFTYGPLLGLYLLGLFTKLSLKDAWVPLCCVSAAAITWWLDGYLLRAHGYDIGFMNILLNAMLTMVFLLINKRDPHATTDGTSDTTVA